MKRITIFLLVLLSAVAFGCSKQKEEHQTTFTPPPAPSPMQLEELKQAASAAPKSSEAWTQYGDALMDAQRFSEAVDAYQKSLNLNPKNPNVLVDQGTCYRGIKKFDKAVENYRKAIKINPNFPNAHRNLGVVLSYDLHNTTEGVKEFQKYLEIVPNAPDAAAIKNSIRTLQAGGK